MHESLILSKFDRLVSSGLVFYDDKQQIIEHVDGDLKFQFILTSALAKKPTLPSPESKSSGSGCDNTNSNTNPSSSDITSTNYEITTLKDTHLVIANKFSFARPHLLLLTLDASKRQHEPLSEADLLGAWHLLTSSASAPTSTTSDWVAFYNCGRDAGCSRLHKHLQVMPLPRGSFAAFLDKSDSAGSGGDNDETRVPMEWFCRRLDASNMTPGALVRVYNELLGQATEVSAGRGNEPSGAACPHNMILSRRWMVVLPRRRGAVNKEAGVNALGMLGVIAVATTGEIENWVRLGLTKALAELGVPKRG